MSAQLVQVANNQRQLLIGTAIFKTENDGKLPIGYHGNNMAWNFPLYVGSNSNGYQPIDTSNPKGFEARLTMLGVLYTSGMEDMLFSNEVVFSPLRKGPDYLLKNVDNWPPGNNITQNTAGHFGTRPMRGLDSQYGWNWQPAKNSDDRVALAEPAGGWTGPVAPSIKETLFRPNDALISDVCSAMDAIDGAHPTTMHVGYFDGHVSSLAIDQVRPLFEGDGWSFITLNGAEGRTPWTRKQAIMMLWEGVFENRSIDEVMGKLGL